MSKFIQVLILVLVSFTFVTPIQAGIDEKPGKLLTGNAVYDEKRYALLYPASLFDADGTPSVFRLGMVWDERNGDDIRFIITFPISEQVRLDDLKKSADSFTVKIDGVTEKLERVRNSVVRKQQSEVFSKSYEGEIRYAGSKKLLDKMLAAKNVEFFIQVMMKKYSAMLRVTDKKLLYLHDKEYTAINGMQRFKNGIWGK